MISILGKPVSIPPHPIANEVIYNLVGISELATNLLLFAQYIGVLLATFVLLPISGVLCAFRFGYQTYNLPPCFLQVVLGNCKLGLPLLSTILPCLVGLNE